MDNGRLIDRIQQDPDNLLSWYERLIDDCKTILTETEFTARWALVEGYHALGKRILEDYDKFQRIRMPDKELVSRVSLSLGKHERTIYRAVQFARKYPNLDLLPEGKDTSWHAICQKYLPRGDAHVGHASGENEWYTPPEYIEAARLLMGSIDVDPASSELANQTVKAERIFTTEDDGLSSTWEGNVWMNPPYAQPLIMQFAQAVTTKYLQGEIRQACILVNNATETEWFQTMLKEAKAVCFIKGRVRFLDMAGNPSGAPLQGQAILYMGDRAEDFRDIFSQFGVILGRL